MPNNRFNSSIRIGINLLAVILVIVVAFLVLQRVKETENNSRSSAQAALMGEKDLYSSADQGSNNSPTLVPLTTPSSQDEGIFRQTNPKTLIPDRTRDYVITYTVRLGDNLFSIASSYGLKPETILWGNYDTLKDNPEVLQIKQILNILPVDGVYYQWKPGDNLDSVASSFKVEPVDILNYSGNDIDLTTPITSTVGIAAGSWLIIPGGKRPLKDWGPPAISRSNPAVARYYGPGSCGSVYEGAIGTGVFVWPTTEHRISGYSFSAIHPAIDIGGQLGNAIYAADSGVVVYAGWSNYGYGNLLVIDHGNGWQTAYAHLSSIGVACGQSVSRGTTIGALGSSGNSSGPHLHFEMSYNGTKVNPLDYVE
jgi:murein DD-endopeptidase MepM/ murein hydrolase activator NlpD